MKCVPFRTQAAYSLPGSERPSRGMTARIYTELHGDSETLSTQNRPKGLGIPLWKPRIPAIAPSMFLGAGFARNPRQQDLPGRSYVAIVMTDHVSVTHSPQRTQRSQTKRGVWNGCPMSALWSLRPLWPKTCLDRNMGSQRNLRTDQFRMSASCANLHCS